MASPLYDLISLPGPLYRLDGLVKAITTTASLGTALALVRIMPRLQSVPSRQEWERVNEQLSTANQQLQAANEELTAANEELAAANEELISTNEQLETAKQTVERCPPRRCWPANSNTRTWPKASATPYSCSTKTSGTCT